MSYQTLDYYLAIQHDCQTIEDVEEAELLGILPGGATEELEDLFPTEEELLTDKALREYLFVENEFMTEEELAESHEYPPLLKGILMSRTPEEIQGFYAFLAEYKD
jgi:hypothetical protein